MNQSLTPLQLIAVRLLIEKIERIVDGWNADPSRGGIAKHPLTDALSAAKDALGPARPTPQLVGQEAAKAMLKRDGFYICGDTRTPGVFAPIAIINGKAYPWEMESTPLDPDRWQPTLLVNGPYDAPTREQHD
jgi:hypothetical protein